MAAFAPSAPNDLTIPDEGSTTTRAIFSMSLRALFEELKRLRPGRSASPAAREAYQLARRAVADLLPGKPGAIAAALRRPSLSAPLRCLRNTQGESTTLLTLVASELLFELALSDALVREAKVRVFPAQLISLNHRRVFSPPPEARSLTFASGKLRVDDGEWLALSSLPPAPGLHAIADDLVLATVDDNPLRMDEAHPDKGGNPIDLGAQPASAWVEELRADLDVVAHHMPTLRDEMRVLLSQIVPVGYDTERHLSASYQEALGTIYMTLHPQRMTMVEALVHEFSHNKINALFELDPLLENAFSPLYSSPVRPDPRPLHGVLLAVHAFLPIARLYERMLEADDELARVPGFKERFRQIRDTNARGADVLLEHAKPTQVGRGVLDEIRRWDEYYGAYEA
ncbi:MAG: hypothetical protein GXP55_03865 [Deltaproteobacteria bacterium]|nr:hypothetical protein [Deltaproteobacteria bacterium]